MRGGEEQNDKNRWGPLRWQPLDLWQKCGFWRQIAALGTVTAMLLQGATSASAALIDIDNLAGAFNNASPQTPPATFETSFSFTGGSPINDSSGEIQSITGSVGTYGNLLVDLTGSTQISDIVSGFTLAPLVLTAGADTITFTFSTPTDTVGVLNFGSFQFQYGVIQATIASVVALGPDSGTLQPLFSDFNNLGTNPSLVFTYNGIDVVGGGASVSTAASGSFSLITGPATPAPESSSAVLSLSGVVAIALAKLARQLRRKNSIAVEETLDS